MEDSRMTDLIHDNTMAGVHMLAMCSVSLVLGLCALVLGRLLAPLVQKGMELVIVGRLAPERVEALRVAQQERQHKRRSSARQATAAQRTVVTAMVAMVARNVQDLQRRAPVLKDDRPVPRLDTAVVRQRVVKRVKTTLPPHLIDQQLRTMQEQHEAEMELTRKEQRAKRRLKRQEIQREQREKRQRAARLKAGTGKHRGKPPKHWMERQLRNKEIQHKLGVVPRPIPPSESPAYSPNESSEASLRRGGISTPPYTDDDVRVEPATKEETQQQAERYQLQQDVDTEVLDLMHEQQWDLLSEAALDHERSDYDTGLNEYGEVTDEEAYISELLTSDLVVAPHRDRWSGPDMDGGIRSPYFIKRRFEQGLPLHDWQYTILAASWS
jgi:hypothetical protein